MSEFFDMMVANAARVVEPVSGQTGVWIYNSKTLVSSAMKMSGVVVSGKSNSITVLSRGRAFDTLVRNSAAMRISAGGYVESTTVMNSTTVSNAGSALSTFLSGGTMLLSNGAVADTVSVLHRARLTVAVGAVATGLYVSSGNVNATVKSGDETTLVTGVNEKGGFFLSGGVASNFLLNSLGQLTVSSGGTALDATIRFGGALTVVSGGTAVATSVESGMLIISSGGTALDIDWNPQWGYVHTWASTFFTFVSNYDGVYYGPTEHRSSAMILSGASVGKGGDILVFSGGTALDCIGIMNVFSGGYAENCSVDNVYGGLCVSRTIGAQSLLTVYSGGTASNIINNASYTQSWGLLVLSGGSVDALFASDGRSYICSGGTATGITEIGGAVEYEEGAVLAFVPTVTNIVGVDYGQATLHSGTVFNSAVIGASGTLLIHSGGSVGSVVVSGSDYDGKGIFQVFSGGTCDSMSVNNFGRAYIHSGGTVSAITENGGYVEIEPGADVSIVPNVLNNLSLSRCLTTVHSGTTANNVVLNNNGYLYVHSGGSVSGVTIPSSYGALIVSSGGTALAVTSVTGANITVENGGYIEYANN